MPDEEEGTIPKCKNKWILSLSQICILNNFLGKGKGRGKNRGQVQHGAGVQTRRQRNQAIVAERQVPVTPPRGPSVESVPPPSRSPSPQPGPSHERGPAGPRLTADQEEHVEEDPDDPAPEEPEQHKGK